MAKKKKKKAAIDLTLWDVILSYPDLHEPKPFKGKVYYKTDVLLDADHAQLGELRTAIKKIKTQQWGPDKTEWPKGSKPLIQNGDEREDQKGYKDRFYLTPSTQTPVPVIDPKGKSFSAQMVKGGMFANVAVRVSAWEYDGDEGVSIYLQGVQIDTSKASLNFGGGKSVKQMFDLEDADDSSDDEDDSDSDDEDDADDEEDQPQPKSKKKRPSADEDDEDDQPRSKKTASKSKRNFDEDEDDAED